MKDVCCAWLGKKSSKKNESHKLYEYIIHLINLIKILIDNQVIYSRARVYVYVL